MSIFDLKVINSVIDQLEEERGIPRAEAIEAIEQALAAAYKKEYGKRGQIVRAKFDPKSGQAEFEQVKIVVDDSIVRMPEEEETMSREEMEEDPRPRFNDEQHILIDDARRMKKDVELEDEMVFPLEEQDEYGRISAQTAKQVIIQKIREAEKSSVTKEFGDKEGEIVSGTVQRIERGNIFVDLGRATGIVPYNEQIPGEHFRQGERIRAYLYSVEEGGKGVFLRLSRSRPEFLRKLFEMEAPEVANGVVEIMAIAREPGARSKVAVMSNDDYVDPVGSLVGQRGVRVATVMSELGGEKIDIVEWSEYPSQFVEEALSPADVLAVEINEEDALATVTVAPDQQSLAIGKGGQNARLAAKLTGFKIDIQAAGDEESEDQDAAPEEAPVVVTDSAELEEVETDESDAPTEGLDTEGIEDSPVETLDNTERVVKGGEKEDIVEEAGVEESIGEQIEEDEKEG